MRSVLGQPWRWRGGAERNAGFARASGLDDVVAGLFFARGGTLAELDRLRAPTIRDWLPDPSIFRDLDGAAARIAAAGLAREPLAGVGARALAAARPPCPAVRRGQGRARRAHRRRGAGGRADRGVRRL